MFRGILLVICGMFIVADIILTIYNEKAVSRLANFTQAVFFGLIFYYIWIT